MVNDVHSGLNPTSVRRIVNPTTRAELIEAVKLAGQRGEFIIASGSRHAMGGQQFATDGVLIDMRALRRIVAFDREKGLLRVEAGLEWPELIAGYQVQQNDGGPQFGIAQKQTGADRLTIGGSLSVNAHGRGLRQAPIISDVEAITLLQADGKLVTCSRTDNAELFGLAIGGYGLFGIITEVVFRLIPRRPLERSVEILESVDLMDAFNRRIADGFLYGDFQFSIDEKSSSFLRTGVFSCYRPTDRVPPTTPARALSETDWMDLLYLAHTDRARAFTQYAAYYLTTNGQVYWSDTHQLGAYLPDYAQRIHQLTNAGSVSSLMISELYVPRDRLVDFLEAAAALLRFCKIPTIYGTVRLIEQDRESFLAWARESYACVIFNLQVEHSTMGIETAARTFRSLIDLASSMGGNYFLTYHRFASKDQLMTCYPQFSRFLKLKKTYDPQERFQSDWYRHYR